MKINAVLQTSLITIIIIIIIIIKMDLMIFILYIFYTQRCSQHSDNSMGH